jgi:uncharacterized repeat protein (TIGR01451 family)
MFDRTKSILFTLAVAGICLVGLVPQAWADGTPSGTPIDNTATIDYTVGGVGQTQIVSNTASFVVDNKIDLTVATVDLALVVVVPGAVSQVLTHTVTNDGNTPQDYSLQAQASAADEFDATLVGVFVDGNANGTYEPLVDTATYVDELGIDLTTTVFIVADIPAVQVDGDQALYDLVAQTAAGGAGGAQGADILNDDALIIDDPATVQIVFGDGAGSVDGPNDGQHSSANGYEVVTATLDVTKSSSVISDPFNGGVNPKAIPGATMGYSIDIDNIGTAAASNVIVEDAIPGNCAYIVGSVSTVPGGATVVFSDDNGLTWTYVPVGAPGSADPAVTDIRVTFANIAAAASAQEAFQVLID